MKAADATPTTPAAVRRKRRAKGASTGQPRGQLNGSKAVRRRAQQKLGGYKRVEVFLGVEAAIALRQLMRDGRSAREVIEAALLAERQRGKGRATPGDRNPGTAASD